MRTAEFIVWAVGQEWAFGVAAFESDWGVGTRTDRKTGSTEKVPYRWTRMALVGSDMHTARIRLRGSFSTLTSFRAGLPADGRVDRAFDVPNRHRPTSHLARLGPLLNVPGAPPTTPERFLVAGPDQPRVGWSDLCFHGPLSEETIAMAAEAVAIASRANLRPPESEELVALLVRENAYVVNLAIILLAQRKELAADHLATAIVSVSDKAVRDAVFDFLRFAGRPGSLRERAPNELVGIALSASPDRVATVFECLTEIIRHHLVGGAETLVTGKFDLRLALESTKAVRRSEDDWDEAGREIDKFLDLLKERVAPR